MAFLRRRRFELPASKCLQIRHVVVVAGPSGSGKSLFMRELAGGRLPAELMAALPSGAADWPQTNGARIFCGEFRYVVGDDGIVLHGLVLHYDFMRIFETRIEDYARDPALAVLDMSRQITAVVLRPTADRLAAQLRRKPSQGGLLRRLRRRFRPLYRRTHSRIYGGGVKSGERHARLELLFRDPAFRDSWDNRWMTYLRTRFGTKLDSTILVEPADGPEGIFRILKDTPD